MLWVLGLNNTKQTYIIPYSIDLWLMFYLVTISLKHSA